MAKHVPPLERRRRATEATVARFQGKPFSWGTNDCARMVSWHLRQLGISAKVAKAGTYKTANSARAALKRAGHASLPDALDSLGLERIAPAAALAGDVIEMADSDGFGALGVSVGNGAALAWHEDSPGAVIVRVLEARSAWRVI